MRRDVNQIFDQFLSHINEVDINNKKLALRVKSDGLKIAQDKLVDANREFVEKTKKMKERIKKKQDDLQKAKQKANENIIESNTSALRLWWNGMDSDWQRALKSHVKIQAEPTDVQLKQMAELKSFSLRHFDTDTIAPISMMPNIQKLDLSNTSINDLTPLENAKALRYLDITYTLATDFQPVQNLDLNILKCKHVKVPYEQINQYGKKHPQCRIFWDLEQDKNWLDSVEDVEDNLSQAYIKTESKIRESQMARELSPLQSAYAEFFFNKLAEFDVDTPAALSDEKKVEFFNSIKNDWKIEKKELAKAGIKPVSENLYPDRELIGIIWSDMTTNDQARLSKMIKVKILDNDSSRKQVLAALKNTPVHIIKKQFPELYENADLSLKEKAVIAEHTIRNKTKVSKIITAGLSEYMLNKKGKKLTEGKSVEEMIKDASKYKKELADLKREYSKSKSKTNKSKIDAKEEQLRRVADAIRNARADAADKKTN